MISSKRVLIISRSFYPDISPRSFRTTELVKEFCRQGHVVTIITPYRPEIDILKNEFGFTFIDLGKHSWRIPKFWDFKLLRFFQIVLVRLMAWLFEYPNIQLMLLVKRALRKVDKNYDLLISVAVPYSVHWGVALVRNRSNRLAKVWVADCGDPFMGQENDTFTPPFYFKWVEKWFMRKADYISVPTSDSFKGYYPEFHSKMLVIPQGFRFEDIKLSESIYNDGKVHFGYAGMFIPGKRDPTEFLEYLMSLPESNKFVFHIYTKSVSLVTPYLECMKERVILHNILPRDKVLFELSKMHFVVNFENAGTKQTPSKLIDYAILNKPIISIKTGNLDKVNIDRFLNFDYSQSYKVENPEKYRIEKVANQFLNRLIEHVN